MKNIIVTVRSKEKGYSYDLEIPIDLEAEKLLDDIVQTLNGCDPSLYLQAVCSELVCERTGRKLENMQTAEEAGIRNGDFITLRRKG
ncbi:MAG: EsaB/YukD family protein [Roseburia sp.]|nr:EsaB/YukD family protein [Roseburia sp.]